MSKKRGSLASWWLGTIHLQENPNIDNVRIDQSRLEARLKEIATYGVWQLEQGEQGREAEEDEGELSGYHIQICIRLKKQMRAGQLREWSGFPRAMYKAGHWETVRNIDASIDYCQKEDSRTLGPWTFGERPQHQGRRTDIEVVAQEVRDGATMRDIAQSHPGTFVKFHKGFGALKLYLDTPMERDVKVYIFEGPPGCGKSHYVRYLATRGPRGDGTLLWTLAPGDGFWFDGYDGQPIALLDDFAGRASKLKLNDLLQILDKYITRVPVKGGYVLWRPSVIFITTNIHPGQWYDYTERPRHHDALRRRITACYQWRSEDRNDYYKHKRGSDNFNTYWPLFEGMGPPLEPGRIPRVETPDDIRY